MNLSNVSEQEANVTSIVLTNFTTSSKNDTASTNDTILDLSALFPANWLESRRNDVWAYVITTRTASVISMIGSVCLIVHILRSHHGFSTTYHRLMLGICSGDIIVSFFVFVLGPVMVPEEMSYAVPGARGNLATCTLQGFLGTVGMFMTTLYNCSVCLYYLAIVKYGKREAYIRRKLEPWFHRISAGIPLFFSLYILVGEGYNTFGHFCAPFPNSPPHCQGEELGFILPTASTTSGSAGIIPCGRGKSLLDAIWYKIFWYFLIVGSIVLIAGSMLAMYITIHNIERRAQRYGVAALRLKGQKRGNKELNSERQQNAGGQIKTNEKQRDSETIMNRIVAALPFTASCGRLRKNAGITTARKVKKPSAIYRKRAVLHMAAAYSLAWICFWVPSFLTMQFYFDLPFEVFIMFACQIPLFGFFHFIIFMMPKVKIAKRPRRRGSPELSWTKAFFKAYFSRGEERMISSGSLSCTKSSSCCDGFVTFSNLNQSFGMLFKKCIGSHGQQHESTPTTNHKDRQGPPSGSFEITIFSTTGNDITSSDAVA